MTEFEQRSLELFKQKQRKALIEKNRKSFRRWFDPLRKLEPDYHEEQIYLIPRCRGCDNDWPITMVKAWEHGKKPVLVKCHQMPAGRLKEVMVCEDKKL